jgi:hypothetical protein
MSICCSKYCRRKAKRGRFCYRCEHENRKRNNPYKYWLGVNRRNAKRRRKKWNISLEYWVKWCDATGYLALKGRFKYQMSIDRIDPTLGYVDGNLAPLTVGDNASKGQKKVVLNIVTKEWEVIEVNPIKAVKDQPF